MKLGPGPGFSGGVKVFCYTGGIPRAPLDPPMDATPADLLVDSMVAESFLSMYLCTIIGWLKSGIECAAASQFVTRRVPNQPCRPGKTFLNMTDKNSSSRFKIV